MIRFILLALFCCPFLAISQGTVPISPSPKWVEKIEYSPQTRDTLHSGGYYYLLLERQSNVELQESYRRTSIRVLTETGLETASSININFEPSFQKLVFHNVIVRRGSEAIDKLKTNKFEILRREESMDRLVYDKSLDAVLNLDDIKVGDVIEYDYTIRGYNPVFEGRFFQTVYLNYSVPVGKIYHRIICKTSRNLQFRLYNKAIEPRQETNGNTKIYTWDLPNVPALLREDNVPSWYDVYNNVELTDFRSWGEVTNWALPLYSLPKSSAKIDAKIDELKREHQLLEDQISAAIQFVQDEIRYLSFSDGIQGYKPHNPANVFAQRFGDCKDKSLLLSYMLTKLGVKSYPALVSTTLGKTLSKSLPSPTLFDHCITQFTFQDSVYWVDPTMKLQRGKLSTRKTPNYYNALILSPATDSLSSMHYEDVPSRIKIEEVYAFRIVGGTGTLKVSTTYSGQEANNMRDYWKSNSAEEIKQSYTNFYANDYADIQLENFVEFTDNEKENILTTTESYTIETLWSYDSVSQRHTADFYARSMANYLDLPSTKVRSMPYYVSHPVKVDQTITIHLPEPWNITEASNTITSPAFRFTSETDYIGDKVKLYFSYSSTQDYVEAAHVKSFIEKLQSARNDLSFQLTYGSKLTESTSTFNMPFLLIGLFVCPLLYFSLKKLFRYDPRSRNYLNAYDNIGGWLILPAIGIFITPLRIFATLVQAEFLNYVNWEILTNPTHTSYNPSLGILTLIEYIYNLAMIGFSVLLIILLSKKRTSFPTLVCGLYGANVLILVVETFWLHMLGLPTAFEIEGEVFSTTVGLVSAMIWIPFFTYSDRVKGTFRERLAS